jgi:hypothetical protein
MADLPKSIACSEIEIVPGLRLQVHVLDTGQRVIEQESMHAFLRWLDENGELSDEVAFLLAKKIKEFADDY